MIKNKRLRGIRFSPFTILVAIVLVIVVTAICLLIFLPKSDKVKYDIVYDGIDTKGMIVRDEQFIDLSGYEKLYFNNVVEGQFVEAGTDIVSAYKKGYIKNTLEKLNETEKSIVTYQNQNIVTGFDDKQLQQFDFQIDVVIGKMSAQESGFIELYAELCILMKEREAYIRANYTPDQHLEELYNDEKNLTASLEAWCDHIASQNEGYIGFYCDGAEKVYNSTNVLNISYAELNTNLKKGFSENLTGFKTVIDSKWYVIVDIDKPEDFAEGNYYQVYINNESDHEYGFLEKIIDEKKGSALVFSFSDNVEKYLDLRITKVFIGVRYEGYSVKNGFIKDSTAIIKVDKKKTQVPVEILYQDKDKTVFKYTDEISLGQKVYNK